MSEITAREECATALAQLSRGRSKPIEPGHHGVEPSRLVDIAFEVRRELGVFVRIAWRDGAVQYVAV